MKIKHLIITRFFPADMGLGEKLFDYEFLHSNLEILKNYLLNSLENQTNKNFDFVLMLNDKLNTNSKIYKELKNIQCSFNTHLIKKCNYVNFLNDLYKDYDYVITTRIDHDDLVYKFAVENIQNKVDENYDIIWQGLTNGATIIKNDIENVYEFSPRHKSISIFQSIIVNTRKFKGNVNIYNGNHTKTIERLNIIVTENDATLKIIYDDTELAWLYVNHNTNISIFNNQCIKEKWHRTNIKLEKDAHFWIDMFGMQL